MKLAVAIALSVVLIFVSWTAFNFLGQEHELNQNLSDIEARLTVAKSQEADLQAETQYLQNPANLAKELRADFNYKKPGETMIIIVPQQASSTP